MREKSTKKKEKKKKKKQKKKKKTVHTSCGFYTILHCVQYYKYTIGRSKFMNSRVLTAFEALSDTRHGVAIVFCEVVDTMMSVRLGLISAGTYRE